MARLDAQIARRILVAMRRYADTGGGGVRRLIGAGGELRLRVGNWRVRFVERVDPSPASLTEPARTIRVLRVRHRREAYDDL
jgi:hypothetical protein